MKKILKHHLFSPKTGLDAAWLIKKLLKTFFLTLNY